MASKRAHNLRDATEHLAYEIDMFYQQGEKFERLNEKKHGNSNSGQSEQQGTKPKQIVLNALCEAFYVHARILINFIYNRGSHGDMRAREYCKQWKPCLPQELDQLSCHVNAMIMHLTWNRDTLYGLTRRWPVKKLMEDLAGPLVEFHELVENTSPNLFAPGLAVAIGKCRKYVA